MEKDIVVVGGGVAGLVTTAVFAVQGFDTLCIDPVPPITEEAHEGSDLRSTAFLMPAIRLMDEVGLWQRLAPFAAPLRTMRLVDAGGQDPVIREQVDFAAEDVGEAYFGYNLPNWLLRRELVAYLNTLDHATICAPMAVTGILPRLNHARLTLSNTQSVDAKLVIAADGRNSFIRNALGISAHTTRYGQKALVFGVTHTLPHHDISTEIHRTGGPFTLVPLLPEDGVNRSAVVWMETGPKATVLMDMDEARFNTALNERSCDVLGELALASPRRIWPIISQKAHTLTGPRTALIAEAAHVMPPIGAQGLNTSLADVRVLVEAVSAAKTAGQDIGGPSVLHRYEKVRAQDISFRLRGIDLLNRAAMTDVQPLRDLRRAGLKMLGSISPLKQAAMRMGLGTGTRHTRQ